MYDELFISSPNREIYDKEKENISEDALVFLEDEEKLLTPSKEYQFVTPEMEEMLKGASKYALFDDMWEATGGAIVDKEKHIYGANDLNNLTYEQALLVLRFGTYSEFKGTFSGGGAGTREGAPQIRTTLPVAADYQFTEYFMLNYMPDSLESIKLYKTATYTNGDAHNLNTHLSVIAKNLKHIYDKIRPTIDNCKITGEGTNCCPVLETIYLVGITKNVDIRNAPKLSLQSCAYLVEMAKNTADITVTVHADVYAKLTDEGNAEWNKVFTDAVARKIAFATV